MLADDGVLTEDNGQEGIHASEDAAERWDADLLAAADDLLRGHIAELDGLAAPVQVTMLGLHPHADGTLRGPEAATIIEHQIRALLGPYGVPATPA